MTDNNNNNNFYQPYVLIYDAKSEEPELGEDGWWGIELVVSGPESHEEEDIYEAWFWFPDQQQAEYELDTITMANEPVRRDLGNPEIVH